MYSGLCYPSVDVISMSQLEVENKDFPHGNIKMLCYRVFCRSWRPSIDQLLKVEEVNKNNGISKDKLWEWNDLDL